jgi:trans-4-hydroxy-L-proline dehydratase
MREKIFENMNPAWLDCYEAGLFTEFMEQRAPGHTVADDKIYRTGMLDLITRIKVKLTELEKRGDPDSAAKQDQLQAMAICAEALIRFAERHAELAEEKALVEQDSARKDRAFGNSPGCRQVPAKHRVTCGRRFNITGLFIWGNYRA